MADRRIQRTKQLSDYLRAMSEDVTKLHNRNYVTSIAANAIGSEQIGEDVVLDNKTISSSNYLSGISGWMIDGFGNAEFANVFVRGDINAYSGTIGYWNISQPLVTRTFGDNVIRGTLLESSDLGITDDDVTSGTYVGLFKSYIDFQVSVTSISRESEIATATVLDHNYSVGDYVKVRIDEDSSFDTNSTIIVDTSSTTFKYYSAGDDITIAETTGYSILATEDIAGLYLRDYSKANFDYGFFSNKGIAYTSAEVLNLIHNPSFEYKISGGSNTYSTSGWSATSGITQMTFGSGYSTARYASEFGASIIWTSSSRTDYLTATVDYNAGDDYKTFDSSTPLYLGLEIFPAPVLAPVNVSSVSTSGTTHISITTSASHGLTTGDYVYLNFSALDSSELEYAYDATYADYGPKVFEVTSTSGPTVFFVKNSQGVSAGSLTLSASPKIYPKVVSPAFKLSEIKLKFGSDETTTLEDVLDEVYKTTDWATSSYKELSISATEAVEDVINSVAIPPMKNGGNVAYVPINPEKIKEYYISLDSSGYASASPFYILLPTWTYKKDLDGATTATKLLNTSYVIDNVYLSKSSKFFYADSSTVTNSWYTLGSGTTAPAQASVEAPRNWIDIDLDSQTAIFDYIDYIGLESSTYSQPLYTKPSISMAPSATDFTYIDYLNSYSSYNSYIPTLDSNTLSLTAGKSRYLTGSTPFTIERDSYINISVDRARSGVEMVAKSTLIGVTGSTASISASIDKSNRSLVSIQATYIVANTAKFVTDVGKPSLNAAYVTNNTSDSTSGGTNHIVYELETTDVTGITSETFAAGATECSAFFTTGPSGVAEIHVYGDYENTTSTGLSFLSFQIADAATLTTVIDASTNRSVIRSGSLRESGTVFYVFTGTANTRYRIRTMHRTTTGTTLAIRNRSIMVIPIT